MRALNDAGVDVIDIGLGGTECVYFATFSLGLDGGVMVTASHNPPDYNGLKFVREQSRPISGDSGLQDIRKLAEDGRFTNTAVRGTNVAFDIMPSWRDHVLGYVDIAKLKPLSFVCNAGNGGAGQPLDLLADQLPFRFTKIHHDATGFPEWRAEPDARGEPRVTARSVRLAKATWAVPGMATSTAASFRREAASSPAITSAD